MQDYPARRFNNVIFAGSVVRTDYDWASLIKAGRIQKVLNFVATADWVVAVFPSALRLLGRDVGGAGHRGFRQQDLNLRYIQGAHSAAICEENWDTIAEFALTGTLPPTLPPALIRKDAPTQQLTF